MGARAQVKVEGVYLYTHYGAKSLRGDVARGLDAAIKGRRLTQPDYLTRIIFDAMRRPKSDEPTTGYGIGTAAMNVDILIEIRYPKFDADGAVDIEGIRVVVTDNVVETTPMTYEVGEFVDAHKGDDPDA